MFMRIGSFRDVNRNAFGWVALLATITVCELLHHGTDRAAHNMIFPLLFFAVIAVSLLFWDGCKRLRPTKRFKNISRHLAAGRGGWLRYSSVTDFLRICTLVVPRHPSRRARNPAPTYFQNRLSRHCLTQFRTS